MRYLLTTFAFCCCAAGVYAADSTEEIATVTEEVVVPVNEHNEADAPVAVTTAPTDGGCGCPKTKK